MQRRTKAAIFDRCLRAVRLAANKPKDTALTVVQIENIMQGRKVLLRFIQDLASKRPKYYGQVERALEAVHPRTEYCSAMLIRDLADVCVTLNRLGQGRRRSEESKPMEAGILLQSLKQEFGITQPSDDDAK